MPITRAQIFYTFSHSQTSLTEIQRIEYHINLSQSEAVCLLLEWYLFTVVNVNGFPARGEACCTMLIVT